MKGGDEAEQQGFMAWVMVVVAAVVGTMRSDT
jgi:hypothetical protein